MSLAPDEFELPATSVLDIVTMPSLKIPPPLRPAELLLTVTLNIANSPLLAIPPPDPKRVPFPLTVTLVSVAFPSLKIAPPSPLYPAPLARFSLSVTSVISMMAWL